MKYLPFIFFAILLTSHLAAQNVGIGQPSPASKFDVKGNLTIGEKFSGTSAPKGGALIEGRVGMSVDSASLDSFARLHIQYPMKDTASMSLFTNTGRVGVALSGINRDSLSPYNGLEGITHYIGTNFAPTGVLGLAIEFRDSSRAIGVRGATNNDVGIGVFGTRLASTSPTAGGGFGGLFYNDIGFSGGFYNVSDERFKHKVEPLQGALSQLMQVQAVSYKFDVEKYPYFGLRPGTEYGLLAQQLETVFPEMVVTKTLDLNACKPLQPNQPNPTDLQEVKMVDYLRMVPVLIKAIQEQQETIESLEKEIQALKNER